MIKKQYSGKLPKDQLNLLQDYLNSEMLDFPSKFEVK